MIWLIWLILFKFPQVAEYGTADEIAFEVMHSGDYGSPAETIQQAKSECLAFDGCQP